MAVLCTIAISCCPSVLCTMSRPARMVAVRDFSGLTSSACALANAGASAVTVSLDRGMVRLHLQHIKAHRPRFRALGFHAVPDSLLGILRHQGFELGFCP